MAKQPNNAAVPWRSPTSKDRQGDLAGAMQEMQKTIALDPNRSDAFLNYAIMQIQGQQFDAAEPVSKKPSRSIPRP